MCCNQYTPKWVALKKGMMWLISSVFLTKNESCPRTVVCFRLKFPTTESHPEIEACSDGTKTRFNWLPSIQP